MSGWSALQGGQGGLGHLAKGYGLDIPERILNCCVHADFYNRLHMLMGTEISELAPLMVVKLRPDAWAL